MYKLINLNKNENYIINQSGDVININTYSKVKQHINNKGYVTVTLYINKKAKTYLLHRLVALTFLADKKTASRCYVNHKNCNKRDNHVNNLNWVTRKENDLHYKILYASKLIARKPRKTLTQADKEVLKFMVENNATGKEIKEMFNISHQTVYNYKALYRAA